MTTALVTLTNKLAQRFDMGDGKELMDTLKATAFKGPNAVSDAQMTALLIVANQFGLNPWTKEIYAFPDKGGIVPVVGVDGWSRIINDHPQFDGIEFDMAEDACTCRIYRKDRAHPVTVTEYLAECRRDTAPWKSHPRRMLRHKAMIQAARLAFGYGGIYDQDEAERVMGEAERVEAPPPAAKAGVAGLKAKLAAVKVTLAQVTDKIQAAETEIDLKATAILAEQLPAADQAVARDAYKAKLKQIRDQAQTVDVDTETGEIVSDEVKDFFGEGDAA